MCQERAPKHSPKLEGPPGRPPTLRHGQMASQLHPSKYEPRTRQSTNELAPDTAIATPPIPSACSGSYCRQGVKGLAGHLDQEQPCVDYAAKETRHGGRDQPVQATTGLRQEGDPGNANEHGGDRVGGELLDVAGHTLIGTVTGSPVQDAQG